MVKRKYRIREVYRLRRDENHVTFCSPLYYLIEYYVGFRWFGWWVHEPIAYRQLQHAHDRLNELLDPAKPRGYNILREEEIDV